jgi:hypothetical protein
MATGLDKLREDRLVLKPASHVKLLRILTTTFAATELHVIDKRYLRIRDFEDIKWLTKDYHEIHFNQEVNVDKSQHKIQPSDRRHHGQQQDTRIPKNNWYIPPYLSNHERITRIIGHTRKYKPERDG